MVTHHVFLSVGSGVFSTSSEADDSDNLYGWSFNRSHHLWWPVRQVKPMSIKPVKRCFTSVSSSWQRVVFPVNLSLLLFFRFGRRSVLIWSYLQLAILGCSSALSPSYSVYCILRFLCGMAVSGIILNAVSLSKGPLYCHPWSVDWVVFFLFILSYFFSVFFTSLSPEVEWIPTKERTLVGTLTSFFFTFGQMILSGLAYWLRDWRKLQLAVCLPHFLFFAYSWSV